MSSRSHAETSKKQAATATVANCASKACILHIMILENLWIWGISLENQVIAFGRKQEHTHVTILGSQSLVLAKKVCA